MTPRVTFHLLPMRTHVECIAVSLTFMDTDGDPQIARCAYDLGQDEESLKRLCLRVLEQFAAENWDQPHGNNPLEWTEPPHWLWKRMGLAKQSKQS